jgi:hypothetical protein
VALPFVECHVSFWVKHIQHNSCGAALGCQDVSYVTALNVNKENTKPFVCDNFPLVACCVLYCWHHCCLSTTKMLTVLVGC